MYVQRKTLSLTLAHFFFAPLDLGPTEMPSLRPPCPWAHLAFSGLALPFAVSRTPTNVGVFFLHEVVALFVADAAVAAVAARREELEARDKKVFVSKVNKVNKKFAKRGPVKP